MMKTKYDKEIEKLERGTARVDARLKKLKLERLKITRPYDDEINKVQITLHEGYSEIRALKHNREIWIRNQELQKNKDLFAKGMSFKDLLLTGKGIFSDYEYFLKSGTEVIPILHLSAEGVNSEDELRYKAKKILSNTDEMKHLSRAFWGRYLEFAPDVSIRAIRMLYQSGFKFKSSFGGGERIEFRESDRTMMARRKRGSRGTYYPLSYARKLETVTVIKKEIKL